jgi:DNA-binding transcriptional ArsR family regulator
MSCGALQRRSDMIGEGMSFAPQLAEVAQLLADPARAQMLFALLQGGALTAGELAEIAGVTPQTTSSHLTKFVNRDLLAVEQRGSRRFFRLATPLIAQMIEGMMIVAVAGPPRFRPPSKFETNMRYNRICYDHLAGRLGVAIAAGLVERGYIMVDSDGGEVTEEGLEFLRGLADNPDNKAFGRRTFCRLCLDWSERQPHLTGQVGAYILNAALERGWIRRQPTDRSVEITVSGLTAFTTLFGARI